MMQWVPYRWLSHRPPWPIGGCYLSADRQDAALLIVTLRGRRWRHRGR